MKPSALTVLLFALALVSCDDGEHSSNLPPDLRLEDVVGCWNRVGGGYCDLTCFDDGRLFYYKTIDYEINRTYEESGIFDIDRHMAAIRGAHKSSTGNSGKDSFAISIGYRRLDNYLYTLDDNYQLAKRYDPIINLDSLPCGQPFTLLPKPANWTLF